MNLINGGMLAAILALTAPGASEPVSRLAVAIEPRFGGAPLAFDALTNTTVVGQPVSVTRLDFLLSNIALRRADGAWLGLTNWFAYLSLREGRTSVELNNLPAGSYDRLRFQVGVPPAVNHADPAQFDAAHPLNPNVNGLHWNWQGGYVFLAIEGNFQPAPRTNSDPPVGPVSNSPGSEVRPVTEADSSQIRGYSYHLANDRLLTTIELPVPLDLTTDHALQLALNVDHIFSGQHPITITDDTASTHSREGDPVADQLRENLQRAFAIERRNSLSPADGERGRGLPPDRRPTNASTPLVASGATPYRLTISRFFPRPALPLDNPLTDEGVHLGRLLFFDPRLSRNNAQSCASCHQAEAAFVDPGRAFSLGVEGQAGTRNAMSLFNLAWKSSFFWDGRAPTLREQTLQPIQNPSEMHETLDNAVAKLRSAHVNAHHLNRALRTANHDDGLAPSVSLDGPNDYPSLFARAFGSPEISAGRLARALEQFLLTLVSHDSKFDRVAAGQSRLTAEEQRGLELFRTEYDPRRGQFGADCFHCHGGPLFQNLAFANNGLDVEPRDGGRYLVTGQPGDKGKFAVPSLRNVALTGPYMHDGRFATLEEVVQHYSTGVRRSSTLDPNLAKHPDGGIALADGDQRALVAFLKTLTEDRLRRRPTETDPAVAP